MPPNGSRAVPGVDEWHDLVVQVVLEELSGGHLGHIQRVVLALQLCSRRAVLLLLAQPSLDRRLALARALFLQLAPLLALLHLRPL